MENCSVTPYNQFLVKKQKRQRADFEKTDENEVFIHFYGVSELFSEATTIFVINFFEIRPLLICVSIQTNVCIVSKKIPIERPHIQRTLISHRSDTPWKCMITGITSFTSIFSKCALCAFCHLQVNLRLC